MNTIYIFLIHEISHTFDKQLFYRSSFIYYFNNLDCSRISRQGEEIFKKPLFLGHFPLF